MKKTNDDLKYTCKFQSNNPLHQKALALIPIEPYKVFGKFGRELEETLRNAEFPGDFSSETRDLCSNAITAAYWHTRRMGG